jgi:hypothetical protein
VPYRCNFIGDIGHAKDRFEFDVGIALTCQSTFEEDGQCRIHSDRRGIYTRQVCRL